MPNSFFVEPRNLRTLLALCALVGLVQTGANATALLQPTSGATQVLRPRALDIESKIDGAWAQTRATTIFARSSRQTIEADLWMTVPDGAIVTGFAYWHGQERVEARVQEREVAREVSESNTRETPAPWTKLEGRNVFRARLHAIKPKRDLRVELTWIQPLQNAGPSAIWQFPLASETREGALDWLRVRVAVPQAFRARNNFGAGVSSDEITLRKYNFKPKSDARITLPILAGALKAQLTSEHFVDETARNPKNGFVDEAQNESAYFALSLRNSQASEALPTISGVETETFAPTRLSPSEIQIVGRYRGSGAATISWGQNRATVWFPPASNAPRETNRLASSLWGARRLDELANRSDARASSIRVSQRFGVASKWTDFVAIPAKQRVFIEAQIQQSDLRKRGANLGRIVALEIENGDALSPKALQARADLRALERSSLGRRWSFSEERARAKAIQTRLGVLAREVMARRMSITTENAESEKQMTTLARYAETPTGSHLRKAELGLRRRQVETLSARWQREIIELRGQTPAAKALKTQLETLRSRYGMSDEPESEIYRRAAQQMAFSVLNEALEGRENERRAAVLMEAGERFTRRIGENSWKSAFYQPAIRANLERVGERLTEEIEAGRDGSNEAREAQNRLRQLLTLAPNLRGTLRQKGSLEWQIDAARRALADETAYRIAQTRAERPDDRRVLGELEAQLERVAGQTEIDAEKFLENQTARFRSGEPLLTARQGRLLENGVDESAQASSTKPQLDLESRQSGSLILLSLPANIRGVELVEASGLTRMLTWNASTKKWETRLNAPRDERENSLVLGFRVVRIDGSMARFTLNLAVQDAESNGGSSWNLGVWSSAPPQRASVDLPWKERVALESEPSGRLSAPVSVPQTWRGKAARVAFLMVSQADEVTEIVVDWN